ncbi:MAG: metallophosphoesterase [Bdellovibrionales bacterium]
MRWRQFIFVFFPVVLILFCWGFFIEPSLLKQRHEALDSWSGPPMRIAFLSDLHAGAPFIKSDYIRSLVERINAFNPDLILMGGDYVITNVVGGHPMPAKEMADLLAGLHARYGKYAVLGNHDWWFGGEEVQAALEGAGFRIVTNQGVKLEPVSGKPFWLVGVGDDFTRRADLTASFSGVNTEDPRIVFMHDPGIFTEQKGSPFFVALAGHTHGGQVYLPVVGAPIVTGRTPRAWAKGWIPLEMGRLFVTTGIGTTILPVRFNSPPEFLILDLKP